MSQDHRDDDVFGVRVARTQGLAYDLAVDRVIQKGSVVSVDGLHPSHRLTSCLNWFISVMRWEGEPCGSTLPYV